MKIVFRVLLGLFALVLLVAAGTLTWAWSEDRPVDGAITKKFRIPNGEPLAVTAQRLSDEHLIRNSLVFRWLYQVWQGGSFPSGTFSVPPGMSSRETAAYFRHAKPLQIRITVPEGWTASKIARLLEEKQVVSAKDFLAVVNHPSMVGTLGQGLDSLEGRLFPDTYLFPLETPAEEVARTFLQTFADRTAAWSTRYPPEEMEKRIILASIVEREYRAPEEAPLIASVFSNRLAKGIALGSCATIEYILTEVQGKPHPKRIFFVHTQIPSSYNTYLNRGLPPGPIANPGLTALKAAFEPAETDYLYFVVADAAKGTHIFSSNWSEHEKAREAYLTTFVTKG
jgi:UPF0755 protein